MSMSPKISEIGKKNTHPGACPATFSESVKKKCQYSENPIVLIAMRNL